MTAATMFVFHYGHDHDELLKVCAFESVAITDASTGVLHYCTRMPSGLIHIHSPEDPDDAVYIFKDFSALRLMRGVVYTAGKKRIWRRHRPLD